MGTSPAPFSKIVADHDGKVIDKWTGYLDVYDALLDPVRDMPVSLLEIGVNNGGSLEVYGKYFKQAKIIVGCDIEERCRQLVFDDPRIQLVIGDATAVETKSAILDRCPAYDIMIDDGSHLSGDIINNFTTYFPLLAPGGLFIVEDLCCSYWRKWDGGLFHEKSAISFLKSLIDIVNFEHWGTAATPRDFIACKHPERDASQLKDDIFSIQFFNSLCIIKKGASSLGTRVVKGSEDLISPRAVHGSVLRPNETANPRSAIRKRILFPWNK
jgi:hypothetical protein